jgi:hypothetical protein
MSELRLRQRTPTMPRKRPELHLQAEASQSRAEQIRVECAAEAAARLDRLWVTSTTSGLTVAKRLARLDDGKDEPEARGRPCFRCGARGACNHRDEEGALHG